MLVNATQLAKILKINKMQVTRLKQKGVFNFENNLIDSSIAQKIFNELDKLKTVKTKKDDLVDSLLTTQEEIQTENEEEKEKEKFNLELKVNCFLTKKDKLFALKKRLILLEDSYLYSIKLSKNDLLELYKQEQICYHNYKKIKTTFAKTNLEYVLHRFSKNESIVQNIDNNRIQRMIDERIEKIDRHLVKTLFIKKATKINYVLLINKNTHNLTIIYSISDKYNNEFLALGLSKL